MNQRYKVAMDCNGKPALRWSGYIELNKVNE